MEYVQQAQAQIDTHLQQSEFFATIEVKTGVQRSAIALGAIALVFVSLITGFCATIVTSLVGYIYPAFMTLRAIEKKTDDKLWMMYWFLFSLIQFQEIFVDYILFWFWPFHFLKVALIMYLASPNQRGAEKVYYMISPYLAVGTETPPSFQEDEDSRKDI